MAARTQVSPWRRAARRTAAALAAVALAAPAAAAPEWLPLRAGDRPGTVDVRVTEVPGDDVWQVSYVLPQRVAGVRMARARQAFRHLGWGLAPAGSTWHRSGDAERICFPEPVRTFAVSFRSDFHPRANDVAPNVAFSDGSRLLYLGNLPIEPLARCGPGDGPEAAEPAAGEVVHELHFATAPGRTVRVGELAAAGRLTWEPTAAQAATYAFFGTAPAVTAERAVLVLDPSLPAWLADDLRAQLPRLFDHFAGETAVSLPQRPLVAVAHRPAGPGRTVAGAVAGGVASLTVAGEGWAQPSPEARREWFHHVAREAFGLWGSGALRADAESAWLAEAAADVFALRAAIGLGVVPAEEYLPGVVALANRCLVDLDAGPLLTAADRGAADAWDSCGPVALFVAHRAVDAKAPGQGGLGLLFREMFAEGSRAGGVYGTGVFLGWLDKLSGDRATVHALQRLVRQGVAGGVDRYLEGLLRGAGLDVALVAPEQARGAAAVFQPMLRRALVRCACGTTAPEASTDPDCARFAAGNALRTVDDLPVERQPQEAYARLRAAVLMARPLRVVAGDDDQPVALLCPRDTLETRFQRLLELR